MCSFKQQLNPGTLEPEPDLLMFQMIVMLEPTFARQKTSLRCFLFMFVCMQMYVSLFPLSLPFKGKHTSARSASSGQILHKARSGIRAISDPAPASMLSELTTHQ